MHLTRKFLVVSAAMLSVLNPAHADSIWGQFETLGLEDVPVAEDDSRFAGRVQLGYMASRGNTDSTNFNGKVLLGFELAKWRHGWIAEGIYTKDATAVIAETYRAGYKADRKLDDQNYLFGAVSWEKNEFAGYDQRLTEAVGWGRRLLETERHRLDLEVGIGGRQTDLVDGVEESETIARVASGYVLNFGESSEFSQQLAVESGDLNTYIESLTSISSQLVGELDLVATFTARRNSRVPEGREELDTYTTVSVRYNF